MSNNHEKENGNLVSKEIISSDNLCEIWLAGGCFWGLEAYLDRLKGVIFTSVGYANGNTVNPSYEQVCHSNTGHAETVYVKYDNNIISLTTLLTYFFKVVDPTSINRQGNDRGIQYRSGIYYNNPADKVIIDQAISQEQKKYSTDIVTEVLPLQTYYLAEAYHQKYLEKNPYGYCHIDLSMSDEKVMSKGESDTKSYARPSQEEIRNRLTNTQYTVTQMNRTEAPFANEYWDNYEEGLYVDVVTGEPLFSSHDKFDSGSGWPSFTRPIKADAVVTKEDHSLAEERVEVRSSIGNSHLGHVFNDGPKDKGGLRYCMNSAALRFVPLAKIADEGYNEFIQLIKTASKKE